jgi:hypothetical protein
MELNMSSNSVFAKLERTTDRLRIGATIGLAGGLAEIVVVSSYSTSSGGSALNVARQIASAVHLGADSAFLGLAIHMALAVVLGVALMFVWDGVPERFTRTESLYGFMFAALAIVWGINFFVVLPTLSPSFVDLMPYSVTLISKLMFGLAAAMMLQWIAPVQTGLNRLQASRRATQAPVITIAFVAKAFGARRI